MNRRGTPRHPHGSAVGGREKTTRVYTGRLYFYPANIGRYNNVHILLIKVVKRFPNSYDSVYLFATLNTLAVESGNDIGIAERDLKFKILP